MELASSSPVLSPNQQDCLSSLQHPSAGPKSYLVISGIAKKPNVQALLQIAAAFEVTQVLVVGQERNLQLLQDVIQSLQLDLVRFPKWDRVVEYVHERNILLW